MTQRKIFLKRDDCTGLAFGGNKARKLEFLLADAQNSGADVVITFGSVQSNHTRSTAAAARQIGMDCDLVLAGPPPEEVDGNLLLNRVLGATLSFLSLRPEALSPAAVTEALQAAGERLRAKGRRPYTIAPGGSTPLGVLGYRTGFDELMAQARSLGMRVDHIVVAFGTGGTLAGLILGNILAGRPVRITGIAVAPHGMPEKLGIPPVRTLVEEAAALLEQRVTVAEDDVRILHDYAGRAYAAPTTGGTEALRAMARTEGIFLDPVYTSKAMAGLLGMCSTGEIGKNQTTVFIHTGGTPALFAYKKVFAP